MVSLQGKRRSHKNEYSYSVCTVRLSVHCMMSRRSGRLSQLRFRCGSAEAVLILQTGPGLHADAFESPVSSGLAGPVLDPSLASRNATVSDRSIAPLVLIIIC